MTAPVSGILLALDATMVAAAAWGAVCAAADGQAGVLERLLAWGVCALAGVAVAGVVLGETGGLGLGGFLAVHAVGLAAVLWFRRRVIREDAAELRELGRMLVDVFRRPAGEGLLAGVLAAVSLGFVALAFWSKPVVYDALTYRLPRVALWLQDGRIGAIETDDARLSYMPVVPGLVMAWLLTGTPAGYQPAAVAQAAGGVLLLLATIGLARATGLGRRSSLAAAGLVLGMANIVPQFTSAYTDLFTAGVLAAGFVLWLRALGRSGSSRIGGMAAGLALGSKGTVLYLAPGALAAIGWLAWRHRAPAPAWRRTLVAVVLSAAVFAGPAAWHNWRMFGGVFGPAEAVVWHHGTVTGPADSVARLRLNLGSAFAQLCEPNSQPPWWRAPVRALGEAVVRRMPTQDPFAFDGIDRRANLEKVYAVAAPDADVASTGVLLPGLALAALVTACVRPRAPGARLVPVWGVLLAGFVLFMHWRVQWHPYLFRFAVLAVPWLAVLAAWWLAWLPRRLGLAAWTVAAAATLHGLAAGNFATYQSGWPAATRPGQSLGAHAYLGWRDWSARLDPAAGPLRPFLPTNLPLAAFLRRGTDQRVEPGRLSRLHAASAADAVRPAEGWVIVPAAQLIGREGDTWGDTWLFDGDEANAFSVAAYRALRPGERPQTMLYRNRTTDIGGKLRTELLVRTWDDAPLAIELANLNGTPCRFEARSPLGRVAADLPAGGRKTAEIRVPADFPTLVLIDWESPQPLAPDRVGANLRR